MFGVAVGGATISAISILSLALVCNLYGHQSVIAPYPEVPADREPLVAVFNRTSDADNDYTWQTIDAMIAGSTFLSNEADTGLVKIGTDNETMSVQSTHDDNTTSTCIALVEHPTSGDDRVSICVPANITESHSLTLPDVAPPYDGAVAATTTAGVQTWSPSSDCSMIALAGTISGTAAGAGTLNYAWQIGSSGYPVAFTLAAASTGAAPTASGNIACQWFKPDTTAAATTIGAIWCDNDVGVPIYVGFHGFTDTDLAEAQVADNRVIAHGASSFVSLTQTTSGTQAAPTSFMGNVFICLSDPSLGGASFPAPP